MVGVIVYIMIGFFLFTPIGFFVASYQYKRKKSKEAARKAAESSMDR